jgi:hypothetical protein
MLSDALVADGYRVQFVLLSDVNATDFVGLASVPIFRDASAGRIRWKEMEPDAVKHDTFVFARTGERTLFWDTSREDLGDWSADIRAAVEALGP